MSVFYDLFAGKADSREVDLVEEDMNTMFDTLFGKEIRDLLPTILLFAVLKNHKASLKATI